MRADHRKPREGFNDFLGMVEDSMADIGLQGVIQVASVHPEYRFEGTQAEGECCR